MEKTNPLLTPGKFLVGCNYWASHAGTAMWHDWQPQVVAQDLQRLAEAGLQVLRVFPLWPDFQPLAALGTGAGLVELRHGEQPLADDEAGAAGVSEVMVERFAAFADLARQQGLQLIVGLVTGWMSGRLFVPPAFTGRNVLTDPLALLWQIRFVKFFVRRFREHPAILAWDLGNECNCMGPANREQAWVWTAAIVDAIRTQDATRPVVSGMHSLLPGPEASWRIQDQGELTDVLTTHPYLYFTPYCDQDPVNSLRSELHSTAESRLYAEIGRRPCLIEEIGTLGPMVASEAVAADFIRTVLFSAWAHDCRGLLWWCAFDLGHLAQAPYDWDAYERELGLLRADGTPRPALVEIGRFGRWLEGLPVDRLPPRLSEAVCLVSEGQDQWAVAYSSFILAKQAGFDLTYQYADQPLREAGLYLLPCIRGGRVIPRRRWLALLERVAAGAILYVSHEDGMLSPLTEPFGFEVLTRSRRNRAAWVNLDGLPGQPAFELQGPFRLQLQPTQAQVLGREADGNPVFTRTRYGKGTIYFLSLPLEKMLATTPGAFDDLQAAPYWQIYQHLAQPALGGRVAAKDHPQVGISEHPLDEQRRAVVLINYSPEPLQVGLVLAAGWQVAGSWYGSLPKACAGGWGCALPANDAVAFTVERAQP
jgi:hypothetical protein